MILTKQQIYDTIIACVHNLNLSLVGNAKISDNPKAVLFGENSSLDSMGLLNLIMDAEERLEEHDIFITILDDHALSQKKSPFRKIEALIDYIFEKINNDT